MKIECKKALSDWKDSAGILFILEEFRRRVKRMAKEQDCGQKSGEIELVERLREQSVRITVALHSKEYHKSKGWSGEIGAPFLCSSFPVRAVISIASVLSTTSGAATVKETCRESHFHSLSPPTRPVFRFGC